ncbi:protein eva-1 homolog C isoform X1 [Lepisosteus oculatus]|uniref:protein eva-1 homolog C isoform X1 n=1 Tax=Lepisosteus oculatus TaxID=7918 RepID=UPI0037157F51
MYGFDGGSFKIQKGSFLNIVYYIFLVWTKEMHALADFSGYLSRIIKSHSVYACDGESLYLQCPRHSTITVLSALYGRSEPELCRSPAYSLERAGNQTCSSLTALQKLLDECQGYRACQLLVSNHVFGRDPCPGTPKYLLVSYKCKPTEHKAKIACENEQLKLHCKSPRVINIYSAVYGRQLEEDNICSSQGNSPLFECLDHSAVHFVSKICYAKQKCVILVDDKHFRNPCFPGTRKYLSIVYACVPWILLREADPSVLNPTSAPKKNDGKGLILKPKGSRHPDNSNIIVSNTLMTYGYIKEHAERAALLFISSVCLGLLCALCALAVQVSCLGGPRAHRQQKSLVAEEGGKDEEESEEDSEHNSSTVSSVRKGLGPSEAQDTAEAADMAERIARRDRILLEIWMNTCLNGTKDSSQYSTENWTRAPSH